jgi:hypothetical protein
MVAANICVEIGGIVDHHCLNFDRFVYIGGIFDIVIYFRLDG